MSTIPGFGLSLTDTINAIAAKSLTPAQGVQRAKFMAARKSPGTRQQNAWLHLAARLERGILPSATECYEAANKAWSAKNGRPQATKAAPVIDDKLVELIAAKILAKMGIS
jgi:hypothetical protein